MKLQVPHNLVKISSSLLFFGLVDPNVERRSSYGPRRRASNPDFQIC